MIINILLFVLYNDEVSINDSDKWVFPIKQTAKHKFVTLDDVIGIEQWIYIRLETLGLISIDVSVMLFK